MKACSYQLGNSLGGMIRNKETILDNYLEDVMKDTFLLKQDKQVSLYLNMMI